MSATMHRVTRLRPAPRERGDAGDAQSQSGADRRATLVVKVPPTVTDLADQSIYWVDRNDQEES